MLLAAFFFSCNGSSEHSHEDGHSHGAETHTHENGASHTHENGDHVQESFTLEGDSTKVVAPKEETHDHDHDHDHSHEH